MATQSTSDKKMTYVRSPPRQLRSQGLQIILGTMSYGSPEWQGWVLNEEEGIKHIKAAYDLGIQTFDTANVYSNGLSEVVLGKAIKQHNLPRDEIVVMTKVYFPVAPVVASAWQNAADYPNRNGLSRKHIFESIQASLKRLQLDYVDVLQCHRFDPDTPIEETMQALHDVFKRATTIIVGVPRRGKGNVSYAQAFWSWYHSLVSLARGYLTKPLATKTTRTETDLGAAIMPPHTPGTLQSVEEIAKKRGVTMAQIATAWSLTKVTAPIVGTTSLKNLEELAAAVHIQLSEEEIKELEEPYGPQAVFGHT
ncbi:Aldo kereductase [Rhizoctonia solani]|uniref:Aldo kereductase n=1 Tax=Rhizoctonia solani TaxID=456999 RepID=A0A8H7IJU9_9AGAM|nr:Aldo kereductase [Rhizoctonia solani]